MSVAAGAWTREVSPMVLTMIFEAHQRDALPYPLHYLPGGDFDSYLRQRDAAADWIDANMDEKLWNAIDVLLHPRVRIESELFTGRDAERRHGFHAALRDGEATIAAQQHDRPDVVLLASCGQPEALVQTVAFLPEAPAGKRKPIRYRRYEVDAEPDSWLDMDTPRDMVDYAFRRLRDAWGEITILPGTAYDSRYTNDGISLLWCDYPLDGRYYVENGKDIAAEPVDQQALHKRIANAVRQIEPRAAAN